MLRHMWTFGERSDLAPVYAVVLAAGKRTRLRPLTDDKPKALVRENGTPFIPPLKGWVFALHFL